MFFEKFVGLEAEFLLLDEKGEVVIPPCYLDRDDFPLQGEVRGKQGQNVPETLANFVHRRMVVERSLPPDYVASFAPVAKVGLATYQKAMRACETPKGGKDARDIKNIHGVDISGFSDQIIKHGKIQGIRASCGLHIHFSCRAVDRTRVEEARYTNVRLPIKMEDTAPEGHKALINPFINLYRYDGTGERKVLEATASTLNRPTVEWMVRELDDRFFERFAPKAAERTKYRQAGFYELKPYGFEYRSLPASPDTLEALPEIVEVAFELLNYASEYV
jgi:hypothetical protein